MKKITCLALALLIVMTAASCSSSPSAQTEQSSKSSQSESKPNKSEPTPAKDKGGVTVQEQVLMEQNGILVTLKSLETGGFMGPELKVLVENTGEKAVTVQIEDASINGIMVNTLFSCAVEPGKKANDSITFSSSELEIAGIGEIKDVEITLNICDTSTFETLYTTEPISFSTSSNYVQQFDDSGALAVDQNGIKIVVKKLDSENSFWGADIYVYIENNSDKDSIIQIRDSSFNGFMIDPAFSCGVLAGKKAFSSITLFENQLTENNITDITEMELLFHVVDKDTYDTLFDSDKVTITF